MAKKKKKNASRQALFDRQVKGRWMPLRYGLRNMVEARSKAAELNRLSKRDKSGEIYKAGKHRGDFVVFVQYTKANPMKKRLTKKKKKKGGVSPMFRSALERFTGRDNPGKYKKVTGKGTGWIKADKVRIVKKRGQPDRVEVYRRRSR